MTAEHKAGQFVESLQALPALPNVFNPWRDHDPACDLSKDAPRIRARQLSDYLAPRVGRARLILIAEAPSYRGAKYTGIAMTSEQILLDHNPKIPASSVFTGAKERTSLPALYPYGAAEITASVVWASLLASGVAPESVVLWNAFPCHPHRPGEPQSNRPPTVKELGQYGHVLKAMLELLPDATAVAVGRVAHAAIGKLDLAVPYVRHPAQGGAALFREQIAEHCWRRPKTRPLLQLVPK